MAISNQPTYSEWMQQNPDVMQGLQGQGQGQPSVTIEEGPMTLYQPPSQQVQQPANAYNPADDFAAKAAMEAEGAQEASNKANKEALKVQAKQRQEAQQNLIGAITSRGPQVKPAYGLQGNLYQSGSKVQSDAPQVQTYQGMNPHYMRQKVGQIVAAVMSYGASTTTKGDGSLNQQGVSTSPSSMGGGQRTSQSTQSDQPMKLYGENDVYGSE